MTTPKAPLELRDLARRLLVSSDPALVVETIQAGTVVRLGFELLRDMDLPRDDRPLRDAELAEDLAAFRPGDRLRIPGEAGEVATDLADVAADVQRSLFNLLAREASGYLRIVTAAGLRGWGLLDVLYALEQLPAAQLEQLSAAARHAPPPARPRPSRRQKRDLVLLERRRRRQVATLRRLAEALEHDADRINERLHGKVDSRDSLEAGR